MFLEGVILIMGGRTQRQRFRARVKLRNKIENKLKDVKMVIKKGEKGVRKKK